MNETQLLEGSYYWASRRSDLKRPATREIVHFNDGVLWLCGRVHYEQVEEWFDFRGPLKEEDH